MDSFCYTSLDSKLLNSSANILKSLYSSKTTAIFLYRPKTTFKKISVKYSTVHYCKNLFAIIKSRSKKTILHKHFYIIAVPSHKKQQFFFIIANCDLQGKKKSFFYLFFIANLNFFNFSVTYIFLSVQNNIFIRVLIRFLL